MKQKFQQAICTFLFIVTLSPFAHVEEMYSIGVTNTPPSSFRWNNENWITGTHPRVISFTHMDDNSFYGHTESGTLFAQVQIPNDIGIRVQRFSIDDHSHFVIDGKEIYSVAALSVALAHASHKN